MTAYEEMSSLVNYIQPTKFISFEFSARKSAGGGGKLEAGLQARGPQEVCLTPGALMGRGKRKGSSPSLDWALSINMHQRSQARA